MLIGKYSYSYYGVPYIFYCLSLHMWHKYWVRSPIDVKVTDIWKLEIKRITRQVLNISFNWRHWHYEKLNPTGLYLLCTSLKTTPLWNGTFPRNATITAAAKDNYNLGILFDFQSLYEFFLMLDHNMQYRSAIYQIFSMFELIFPTEFAISSTECAIKHIHTSRNLSEMH